jgi:hypothetical protein
MSNKSLWIDDSSDKIGFENCFIADIPLSDFPLKNEDDSFEDEEDLSPCWHSLEDFKNVDEDFKRWYEKSGFGYIYLAPSYFDLTPYKFDIERRINHV